VSRRSPLYLLLYGLTALVVSQCRGVSLCDDADPSCRAGQVGGGAGREPSGEGGAPALPSAGGAGDAAGSLGLEAGAAGEAGATNALACAEPYENCDVTPLNGCETNLRFDPSHCGACHSSCDGLCIDSRCVPTRVDAGLRALSDLEIEGDYLYFLAGDDEDASTLVRIDAASEQELTLAKNLAAFERVTIGTDRVYVWASQGALWSVLLETYQLIDEGIELDWLTRNQQQLFWLAGTTLFRRDLGAVSGSEMAWRELDAVGSVELAADDAQLVIVELFRPEPDDSNRISVLPLSADAATVPRVLVSEPGEVISWRFQAGYVYWLARYEEKEPRRYEELRRIATSGFAEPELLLAAPNIDGFALGSWVFARCPGVRFHEIKAFDPAHPSVVHRLGSRLRPERMHLDAVGQLRFFDAEYGRLLHADMSWLE
jgi:hypothetical protein